MSYYNSNIQSHASYIIAIAVGLTAFVSAVIISLGTLVSTLGEIVTASVTFVGIAVFVYAIYVMRQRIIYWTIWANVAITLTIDETIRYFNNTNTTYTSKATNVAIMTYAIEERIRLIKKKVDIHIFSNKP